MERNHPRSTPRASRLLPLMPTDFFLLGKLLLVVPAPLSMYLRAHKEDPVMVVSGTAAIFIALASLVFGKSFSATGVSIGYFLVHVIAVPFVFLIWFRCRAKWHAV